MTLSTVEAPAVSVSFMWDQKEHRRLVAQLTRTAKRTRWISPAGAVVALLALLTIVLVVLDPQQSVLREVFPWLLIVGAWLALFRFLNPWLAARRYPKQHPCVSQAFHVALDAEGVRTTCAHSDLHVKWNGIHRVVETNEFLLFFVSPLCAHYLPKRALRDAQELADTRDFILGHMPLETATKGG